MTILIFLFVFLLGLAVGSFLNVVICRLKTGEEIIKKRSHCPKCGQILRWYDSIPILSFALLGGRCRYCGGPISWQYPAVEIAAGLLFLLIFSLACRQAGFQFSSLDFAQNKIFNQFLSFSIFQFLNLIFWFFIISCLVVIFVFDLRHYLIPDKIIYPAIIAAVLFRVFEILNFACPVGNQGFFCGGHWDLFRFWSLGFGIWRPLFIYLLSALGAAAFFLVIVLITRGRGMGIGDIKLAFLMGLLLGWPLVLAAIFLAFFAGAFVGLGLILAKRKGWKSQIPFGPFLVGSTILFLFLDLVDLTLYFNFLLYP